MTRYYALRKLSGGYAYRGCFENLTLAIAVARYLPAVSVDAESLGDLWVTGHTEGPPPPPEATTVIEDSEIRILRATPQGGPQRCQWCLERWIGQVYHLRIGRDEYLDVCGECWEEANYCTRCQSAVDGPVTDIGGPVKGITYCQWCYEEEVANERAEA